MSEKNISSITVKKFKPQGRNKGLDVMSTCELVIGILEEYKFSRKLDINTGYKELNVEKEQL